MNEFLKQNWLKLFIALSILLITSSATYYFFFYLPEERNTAIKLANQIKCQQEGNQLYNSHLKEKTNNMVYGSPEFKFNSTLNTCLYKGLLISENFNTFFIIDVYTNKEIVSWNQVKENGKWQDILGSQREWEEKVNELIRK